MNPSVHPDNNLILNRLTRHRQESAPLAGTFVMPSHATESMCRLMRPGLRSANPSTIQRAAQVMRWHGELAWDAAFGGIFLSCGAAGHRLSMEQPR